VQRAGLIGDPVSHSRSPQMHNAAFSHLGIDARYELWETAADEIGGRIESLRAEEILGANVTVPHKQRVLLHCDRLTDTARRVGAVNTIIPNDGELIGDNTDVYGFARSVREALVDSVPKHALLLGAGGAARGVIVAMHELGVRRLTVANRTQAKALELAAVAADLMILGELEIYGVGLDSLDGELFENVDLLVNATSIGWHDDESPLASWHLDLLDQAALVVDLTYRETALLKAARVRGNRVLDGTGMLLYQGVRAFELWTGRQAPVDIMRAALTGPS
jgi:shikimate dehydrogenase